MFFAQRLTKEAMFGQELKPKSLSLPFFKKKMENKIFVKITINCAENGKHWNIKNIALGSFIQH